MSFSVLLGKMLIFVVLMVIGYLCVHTGYISKAFVADASKLTINVFLVASILNSVFDSEMQLGLGGLAKIIGIMSLMYAVSCLIAFAAAKLAKLPPDREPVFEMLTAIGNNMFIALPVVQQVYGAEGVFYVSMSSLPVNLLLYTYYVYRLTQGRGNTAFKLKDVFSAPLAATVASLVIFACRIPVPHVIRNVISSMSAATMPLSMLVVGASLGSIRFADAFRDKYAYVSGVLRIAVIPAAVYLVLKMIPMEPMLLKAAVIIAASPGAIVCTVLSVQYGRDYVFSSKAILLTTAVSMLTIPMWVYFLG